MLHGVACLQSAIPPLAGGSMTTKRTRKRGLRVEERHLPGEPKSPPNADGEGDGLLPKIVEVHPTGDGFPPSETFAQPQHLSFRTQRSGVRNLRSLSSKAGSYLERSR